MAVATPTGLLVPVIRDCDKKSVAMLESDLAAYAAKARAGKIALEDMTGGAFTISNGGVFGSLMGTPILNYPQSSILGTLYLAIYKYILPATLLSFVH